MWKDTQGDKAKMTDGQIELVFEMIASNQESANG